MDIISFLEMCFGFLLLMGMIALFQLLGIDINFIALLILTIFTIAISIFFYNESNKMTRSISNLISDIKKDVSIIREREIVKDIKTLRSLIDHDKIKGWYRYRK